MLFIFLGLIYQHCPYFTILKTSNLMNQLIHLNNRFFLYFQIQYYYIFYSKLRISSLEHKFYCPIRSIENYFLAFSRNNILERLFIFQGSITSSSTSFLNQKLNLTITLVLKYSKNNLQQSSKTILKSKFFNTKRDFDEL